MLQASLGRMLTSPWTGNRVHLRETVFKIMVILGSLFLVKRETPKNGLEAWPGQLYCTVYHRPLLRSYFEDPPNISIYRVFWGFFSSQVSFLFGSIFQE